jgi:FkbM family methyltransferase
MSHVAEHQEHLIWQFFNRQCHGFFIEVGANHPTNGSLTWFLEKKGWQGILVEPQEKLFALLRQKRPASQVFRAACSSPDKIGYANLHIPSESLNGFATLEKNVDDFGIEYQCEERVEVVTLDSLIEKVRPLRIDVVSIDTEGTELDVLKGFSVMVHKPTLLLIEDKGRSLEKHRFLRSNGYKLVKRTELNNWYVPKETKFQMTSITERARLLRKVFLGLPFRKFRHWRHSR